MDSQEQIIEESIEQDLVDSQEQKIEESSEQNAKVILEKELSLEEALNDTDEKSIQQQIEEIVLERAKDVKSAQLDLKNIVHFNNGSSIRDRLMKGTKQNLEQLKNYMEGYTEETVRLSYRRENKTVKISDLQPDMSSLKEFLADSKNIREVKCTC